MILIYLDILAQSVEHLTFNQGVPRSSRGWITTKNILVVVSFIIIIR